MRGFQTMLLLLSVVALVSANPARLRQTRLQEPPVWKTSMSWLASLESVQKELGLSGEEKAVLQRLIEENNAEKEPKPFDEIARRSMRPEVFRRMEQLVFQYDLKSNGLLATVRDPRRLVDWKITPDQLKRWDEISRETADPLGKALRSGKSLDKIKADVATIRQGLEKQCLAILTPAQRKQWQDAHGRLFPFPEAESWYGSSKRILLFSRIEAPAAQKALGLTPGQVKELLASAPRFTVKVSDQFSPELQGRLRQLHLQHLREKVGPFSLFMYRPIVEALQTTAEQRRIIEPGLKRTNSIYEGITQGPTSEEVTEQEAALFRILSPKQRDTWKALLGDPFPLPFPTWTYPYRATPGEDNWATQRREPVLTYFFHQAFVKDLQLTKGQLELRDQLWQAVRKETSKIGTPIPMGTNYTGEEYERKQELERTIDGALMVLLTREQQIRFEQLRLQHGVRGNFPYKGSLLRDPEIQKRLNLKPEELLAVVNSEKDSRELSWFIHDEVPRILGKDQPWWGDFWEQVSRDVLKQVIARHKSMPTPDLQQRWDALLGKPCQEEFVGYGVHSFGGYLFLADNP